jgi:hypothetical protein
MGNELGGCKHIKGGLKLDKRKERMACVGWGCPRARDEGNKRKKI